MKANELRIGNYITGLMCFNDTQIDAPEVVTTITEDEVNGECEEFINPIPLTEEWLEKFGFNKTDEDWQKTVGRKTLIVSMDDGQGGIVVFYRHDIGLDWSPVSHLDTEYVHQLQNLYFALTGEELTVK